MRFTSNDLAGLGSIPPMPGDAPSVPAQPATPLDLPQAALSKIDRAQGWMDDVLSLVQKVDEFVGMIVGLAPQPAGQIVDAAPAPPARAISPPPAPEEEPPPEAAPPEAAPAAPPTLFDLLQAVIATSPERTLQEVLGGIRDREPWLVEIADKAGFK